MRLPHDPIFFDVSKALAALILRHDTLRCTPPPPSPHHHHFVLSVVEDSLEWSYFHKFETIIIFKERVVVVQLFGLAVFSSRFLVLQRNIGDQTGTGACLGETSCSHCWADGVGDFNLSCPSRPIRAQASSKNNSHIPFPLSSRIVATTTISCAKDKTSLEEFQQDFFLVSFGPEN